MSEIVLPSLSISRAYTFQKCRQQYAYKYLEKLKPFAKDIYIDAWTRMNRGILGHAGMEAAFLGKAVHDGVSEKAAEIRATAGGLSAEQNKLLPGMEADAIEVASSALKWMPLSDWQPLQIDGKPAVELPLRLPLPGWQDFFGLADLVATHTPTGRIFLIDYKFRERFENENDQRYNKQFAVYLHALRCMGIDCVGSMVFQMHPTSPRRSLRAFADNALSHDLDRCSVDGHFKTTVTYRSAAYVQAIWDDFEKEALVMAAANANPSELIYRNLTAFGCRECPYNALCLAELNGEDASFIRESSFVVDSKPLAG